MPFHALLADIEATPWAIAPAHGAALVGVLNERLRTGRADPAGVAEAAARRADRAGRTAGGTGGRVAVIPLHGPMVQRAGLYTEVSGLASTEAVGRQVDDAAADPATEQIVLDIDSPGGSVFGTEELANRVAAAAKAKPVVAVANSLAASAAYYVASQASELVVTPSGMVGSIGVYQMHVDRSEEARMAGQAVTFVASTAEKVAGHPFGPLGDVGRREFESTVGGYYDLFVKAVARGRGVSQTKVRDGFGRGGMVLAAAAVANGMADTVGTLDGVLARYGVRLPDSYFAAHDGRPPVAGGAGHPGVAARRQMLARDAAAADRGAVAARRAQLARDAAPPVRPTPARPPGRTPEADRAAAFHEAGHAVVAHLLYADVFVATIDPSTDARGRPIDGYVSHGLLTPKKNAVVCRAGRAAEVAFGVDTGGCGGDDELVAAYLRHADPFARVEAAAEAGELVRRHRPQVARVAAALLARRTLTGDEVAALVRS